MKNMERRRAEALTHPLSSEQIASLLSMRFNRIPLYKSIEEFYTPEYAEAISANTAPAELSKIPRYRSPTQKEVYMLYNDPHAKDEVYEYGGNSNN